LQDSGMSPFEIQTLCDAASGMKGDQQLCYLKQAIATALGIPFRLAADGREKPLTPFAYLAPVQDLMDDPAFAAKVNSPDKKDNFAAAQALFSRLDFYAFDAAMADPVMPAGAKGSVGYIARELLANEKERRRIILRDACSEDGPAVSALKNYAGFDEQSAKRLAFFVRSHARHIGTGVSAARKHLDGAKSENWLQLWRAAEAAGTLPDEPWVELVRDIASRV
ncbi:MAG: hypothetical protein Q7U14_11115, partial [Lacisediminimonas sp.]|nr:hypothetical protein [Lacisediminimonas sp.]